VYEGRADDSLSWYEDEPTLSLELIDVLGVGPDESVIDVGGGASRLVDRLLMKGFSDVSVLEVAASALAASQRRVGADHHVTWIAQDLASWQPERQYDLWHDRAVLHFFAGGEVATYRALLDRAIA
jgi:trans-aconitate methyltransferase